MDVLKMIITLCLVIGFNAGFLAGYFVFRSTKSRINTDLYEIVPWLRQELGLGSNSPVCELGDLNHRGSKQPKTTVERVFRRVER